MKTLKMLVIAQFVFLAAACSKTGSSGDIQLKSAASCVAQKPAVNPDGLEIKGADAAQKGQVVRYALSEDLSCNTNQEVSWKTVATSNSEGTGSAYVASFKKAGEYVVTASITDPASTSPYMISTKTIVSADLAINGPQIGMAELQHHFSLAVPTDLTLASADWDFGDGSAHVSSLDAQDHTYMMAGDYVVTVSVQATNGDTATLTHAIHVLPPTDGMECVRDLATSGPTTAVAGNPVTLSVFIPQCIAFRVGALAWNFGDATAVDSNQTATHTYAAAGTYTVTLTLIDKQGQPFLTLTRTMEVSASGDVDPEDPPPVDNNSCTTVGAQRTSDGDIFSEDAACGVNGTKTMSYRNHITEECRFTGESRRWVEISRVKELLSEGQCQNQACELPAAAMTGVDQIAMGILIIGGKYYLPSGTSKTFYSSQTPAGSCSEVATTRSCDNGVLGGSTANVFLLCHNGCAGVGPHGTVQTGVNVGQTTVPKTCSFGETGIVDTYTQIADRTCDSGEVKTSNVRTGGLMLAGVCPTYSYGGTENFSACSADCGGTQTRLFECRDDKGVVAPADRCIGTAPVETRVCDGNPAAVRRTESSTSTEDGSSSMACPANQIGTISKTREVVTTKVYACINHQVGLESSTPAYGPWVEERYCKDLVPHRCSQDSLSNEEANGRFLWMQKCRATVPAIDDFLNGFEKLEKRTIYHQDNLILDGRIVYPTFMDHGKNPEKPWIAPTKRSASCNVPAKAYIATVCLASCATPEQMILAQPEAKGPLNYVKIYDAWDKQFQFVATMTSQSNMSSKEVQKTKVDLWVTELVDTHHDVLEFTMKSGRQLRLTPNHPVVTTEGTMKLSGDFKVGEPLVQLGGVRDPIVSINKIDYFGKVYNVFTKSSEIHKNIVVTNGYLNGTAYFQNDGAQHLNRRLLRGALIRGVLDK